MLIKFDKATLCYYLDSMNGNEFIKNFATEERVEIIKPISNQFPNQLELDSFPNLISTSEKIRLANENQLPF